MMSNVTDNGMVGMWGMGLMGFLIVTLLVLVTAALVKYLFFSK